MTIQWDKALLLDYAREEGTQYGLSEAQAQQAVEAAWDQVNMADPTASIDQILRQAGRAPQAGPRPLPRPRPQQTPDMGLADAIRQGREERARTVAAPAAEEPPMFPPSAMTPPAPVAEAPSGEPAPEAGSTPAAAASATPSPYTREQLQQIARGAAMKWGLDPNLMVRWVTAENGAWNPNDRHWDVTGTAYGLGSIHKENHPADYQGNPLDPLDPVAALNYMAEWLKRTSAHFGGDQRKALAAWNAGTPTVDLGWDRVPSQSKVYADRILRGISGAVNPLQTPEPEGPEPPSPAQAPIRRMADIIGQSQPGQAPPYGRMTGQELQAYLPVGTNNPRAAGNLVRLMGYSPEQGNPNVGLLQQNIPLLAEQSDIMRRLRGGLSFGDTAAGLGLEPGSGTALEQQGEEHRRSVLSDITNTLRSGATSQVSPQQGISLLQQLRDQVNNPAENSIAQQSLQAQFAGDGGNAQSQGNAAKQSFQTIMDLAGGGMSPMFAGNEALQQATLRRLYDAWQREGTAGGTILNFLLNGLVAEQARAGA